MTPFPCCDTNLAGLDGRVDAGCFEPDGCCPPSICEIDPCAVICNFIRQLPSGPLWDRAKSEALSGYLTGCQEIISCPPEPSCMTMVDHAIFTARMLIDALYGPLWTALRESNPATAYQTLDEWLERYGWSDCYACACQSPDSYLAPPDAIWGTLFSCDDRPCCPDTYPEELQIAIKRATLIGLIRLDLSPRPNLDALNFAIHELGARLEFVCYRDLELDPYTCLDDDGYMATACPGEDNCIPDPAGGVMTREDDPYRCPVEEEECLSPDCAEPLSAEDDDGTCAGHETLGAPCNLPIPDRQETTLAGQCGPILRQYEYRLVPASDVLRKAVPADCFAACDCMQTQRGSHNWCAGFSNEFISAFYETDVCTPGEKKRFYPGVQAAECLVRSMMPPGAKIKIVSHAF